MVSFVVFRGGVIGDIGPSHSKCGAEGPKEETTDSQSAIRPLGKKNLLYVCEEAASMKASSDLRNRSSSNDSGVRGSSIECGESWPVCEPFNSCCDGQSLRLCKLVELIGLEKFKCERDPAFPGVDISEFVEGDRA